MNNRFESIPYRPGHLDSIILKKVSAPREELEKKILELQASPGVYILTVCCDRVPMAVIGLTHERKGVAQVWSIVSERSSEHYIGFHREISRIISEYQKKLGLVRISLTVDASFSVGMRWAYSLGFKYEGTMKKYGPKGEDHILFARVY